MPEAQDTEYKQQWQDDYLKWICGFANAEGGILTVGVDDKGKVVGVKNASKLLQDIPNKVRDLMGLVVQVNLKSEGKAEYLEVCVEPYPYPVSLRGKYYQRTGTTNQELKGAALDRFILRRQGKHWDGVPMPQVKLSDLSHERIERFRNYARRSNRMFPADLKASDASLIEKLKLYEGDYLKRAAILLFHDDPEAFVGGAFIKIGFFRSESDLAYHDEIHGALFSQVEESVDLIRSKYLKAAISYDGLQRVETYPVPEAALREALLNAVVHRDYSIHAPIQIRIYTDHMKLWNPAVLPEGWDLEKLLGEHASHPFNPDIANTFFRAGEIETWGRGIHRIFEACKVAETPQPKLRYTPNDLWLEFPFSQAYLNTIGEIIGQMEMDSSEKTSEKTSEKIVRFMKKDSGITITQLSVRIGVTPRSIERNIKNLQDHGRIRRIGGDHGGYWEALE